MTRLQDHRFSAGRTRLTQQPSRYSATTREFIRSRRLPSIRTRPRATSAATAASTSNRRMRANSSRATSARADGASCLPRRPSPPVPSFPRALVARTGACDGGLPPCPQTRFPVLSPPGAPAGFLICQLRRRTKKRVPNGHQGSVMGHSPVCFRCGTPSVDLCRRTPNSEMPARRRRRGGQCGRKQHDIPFALDE
jgi:hypothetical protein